jgi:hypothetical protein
MPLIDVYPAPRLNRAAAGGAVGVGVLPPVPRIYPFRFNTPATSRTTVSTPRLIGPALIRSLKVLFGTSGSPNASAVIELGIATSPVVESGVALTVTKAWRSLVTKLDEATPNDPATMTGFGNAASQATSEFKDAYLDLPIADDSFYLVISLINAAGIANEGYGHIVVLEQIDPSIFANFL